MIIKILYSNFRSKKYTNKQLQISSQTCLQKTTSNDLSVKPADNDKFKQKRWNMKRKQKEYYDQHTKEQKMTKFIKRLQTNLEEGTCKDIVS